MDIKFQASIPFANGRGKTVDGGISVGHTAFGISSAVIDRLGGAKYIRLEWSSEHKVIRLTPVSSSLDGYAVVLVKGHGVSRVTIPADFKKAGMPRGAYFPIPEYPDEAVFKWKDPYEHLNVVEDGIGVGDTVLWDVAKTDEHDGFTARGIVSAVHPGTYLIFVKSPEYKAHYPGRTQVMVNKDQVILQKKGK